MKYRPDIYREKMENERLQHKYGENWRIVKRARDSVLLEKRPLKKADKKATNLSEAIGKTFPVKMR